ncbi:MAG: HEPN domain-containing protein [Candidatus Latescibacteria bacterium]|nr:HEPN domain-containing protein [Candidatus Latescibacterota bacterium]
MNDANLKALVRHRLEQAAQALDEARLLQGSGSSLGVMNRVYYAMFYAVLALLATREQETSKHKGAISLFDREFVQPGSFAKDFSRWLHEAFELRLEADYTPFHAPAKEEAEEAIAHASSFVSGVKEYLAPFLLASEEDIGSG